jgi:hypothetical protein
MKRPSGWSMHLLLFRIVTCGRLSVRGVSSGGSWIGLLCVVRFMWIETGTEGRLVVTCLLMFYVCLMFTL